MAQRDNAKLELKAAAETAIVERDEALDTFGFPESLIILAKHRSFIAWFVSSALILTVAVSFLWPNTYTANARIMPPQQNQSMSAAAMLTQLGPLAALAGPALGIRNTSDIYAAILHSRTVADALVDRFSLMRVYGKKRRVDARSKLEDRTLIQVGKDGVISISVDDRDAQRAADLTNGYVDELESLTKVLAVTEAAKRRVFFEREVKLASEDLGAAELALKQTQEKTGLILLDSQSRSMIDSLASLRAQVAAQEVLVRSMRSYATPENPDLIRAEQQLAALREQESKLELGRGKRSIADVPIENVPAAGLEFVRKLREVKYREALFELLAKQYEAAKIDEARDALIVQQLDRAVRPEKRTWPKPTIIIALGTILGLGIAVLAAFFVENMERAKHDPQFAARLQLFRFYLRGRTNRED